MMINRRMLLGGTAAVGVTLAGVRRGRGQAKVVKLGVLNDQSGPYRDIGGMNSVSAVKQAVAEFAPDFKVEVIAADHQNKPDVGVGIARQWFDQDGVDIILDVPTSSVALAVNNVCKEKNKVFLNAGAATSDLTGSQCTPVTIHWSYDTYMLARSTGGAMVKAGGDKWYFVTADYVFGQQLQRDATSFVTKAGGKVLGASPYPFQGQQIFVVLGHGAGERSECAGAGECGDGYDQQYQAGCRVRPDAEDEGCRDADVYQRCAWAGARGCAGIIPDGKFLLGPKRADAGVYQAVPGFHAGGVSEHEQCRVLFGGVAFLEGCEGVGAGVGFGWGGGGGEDEIDAGGG